MNYPKTDERGEFRSTSKKTLVYYYYFFKLVNTKRKRKKDGKGLENGFVFYVSKDYKSLLFWLLFRLGIKRNPLMNFPSRPGKFPGRCCRLNISERKGWEKTKESWGGGKTIQTESAQYLNRKDK